MYELSILFDMLTKSDVLSEWRAYWCSLTLAPTVSVALLVVCSLHVSMFTVCLLEVNHP